MEDKQLQEKNLPEAVVVDVERPVLRRNWYKSGISNSSTANIFGELFRQNDKTK